MLDKSYIMKIVLEKNLIPGKKYSFDVDRRKNIFIYSHTDEEGLHLILSRDGSHQVYGYEPNDWWIECTFKFGRGWE